MSLRFFITSNETMNKILLQLMILIHQTYFKMICIRYMTYLNSMAKPLMMINFVLTIMIHQFFKTSNSTNPFTQIIIIISFDQNLFLRISFKKQDLQDFNPSINFLKDLISPILDIFTTVRIQPLTN